VGVVGAELPAAAVGVPVGTGIGDDVAAVFVALGAPGSKGVPVGADGTVVGGTESAGVAPPDPQAAVSSPTSTSAASRPSLTRCERWEDMVDVPRGFESADPTGTLEWLAAVLRRGRRCHTPARCLTDGEG